MTLSGSEVHQSGQVEVKGGSQIPNAMKFVSYKALHQGIPLSARHTYAVRSAFTTWIRFFLVARCIGVEPGSTDDVDGLENTILGFRHAPFSRRILATST